MKTLFAETLKKLRKEKGLSQRQLGQKIFVNGSTITRWENGSRLPDATITGFNKPKMVIEYAKMNRIDLAFLDIEMGTASGLDLCHTLIVINPSTRMLYLTAYPEYALDAWGTAAGNMS